MSERERERDKKPYPLTLPIKTRGDKCGETARGELGASFAAMERSEPERAAVASVRDEEIAGAEVKRGSGDSLRGEA